MKEIDPQYGYTFASATDAQFDPARRGAIARTSGAYMRYQYDDRNRLWNVFDASGASTPVAAYTHTPAGSLAFSGYANLVATAYDYNARQQLRGMRTVLNPAGTAVGTHLGASTLKANYDYDEAGSAEAIATARTTWGSRLLSNSGRRNRLVESGASSAMIDYDYDNLNRLAKEAVGGDYLQLDGGPGYEATGYDPAGNRRGRSRSASSTRYPNSVYGTSASTSYAHDHNDRLDNDTTATTPSTLFDGNGNTKSHGGVSYEYDFENRLTASAGTVTLTYDGDGNRVKKVSPIGTVHYLVDDRNPTGYPQVLEEQPTTAGAAPTVTYLYGLQRASQKRHTGATGTYYYGYDGLGSVRHLTTKAVIGFTDGSVSDTYNYDAFGVQLPSSTGSTLNNYRFAGEQWDADLGLYYLRARYYDPELGRFWTMDSFQGSPTDPLSLHKYLYCAADPVNNVDPSGLSVEFDAGKGQLVHEQFFDYCVTRGIPKFFDKPIGTAIPGIRGQEGSALRPDVLEVSGKRWFELKPISHRSSPHLAAATGLQLGSYLATLGPVGIPPGDASALVSKGTSIGTIIDPADRQVLEVFLEPSETIPGLVYYYFRKSLGDENESLEFVPLPVPYVSPNWNSAAKAVRLTAGTAAVGAGAVAAANIARTYMLSAQIAILRF